MLKKTAQKKSAVRLGLFVSEKRDGNYYHVSAHIVTIGPNPFELRQIDDENPSEHYRNIPSTRIRNTGDDVINGLYVNNLFASSQGNNDDDARRLYGWETRYQDVYAIDAYKAEQMHKTLTTIDRRTAKIAEQYGRPATFGQYLARLAQATGCTAFVFRDERQSKGWSYDDDSHRIMSIADGIAQTDYNVRQWETQREREQRERQEQQTA